jgi:hypothetical protein
MRLHLVYDKERISFTSTITIKTITIIKLFFFVCLGDNDGKLCNQTLDFVEQWLFYAPPRFILKNLMFYLHSTFMCSAWIPEKTAIIFINSTN